MKIWVNGTFDVLHRGHIELFKFAQSKGVVRVGIDLDERVKQLKGDSRPVNTWEDRKFLLESIKYIDSVVGFGSDEELELNPWRKEAINRPFPECIPYVQDFQSRWSEDKYQQVIGSIQMKSGELDNYTI